MVNMLSSKTPNIIRLLASKPANLIRAQHCVRSLWLGINSGPLVATYRWPSCASINLEIRRYKKTRGKKASEDDDLNAAGQDNDDEDDEDDDVGPENPLLVDDLESQVTDGSQTLTIDINSLRLDAFAKVAFGTTRAKVEEAFYKGEIYLNGEKASKKSLDLSYQDEVDMVKQINLENRNKVDIRRAVIMKLPDKATDQGRMKITIKRWMDLTVDAYRQQ